MSHTTTQGFTVDRISGNAEFWDAEKYLFQVPDSVARDPMTLDWLGRIYQQGVNDGEARGRAKLQCEIQNLLLPADNNRS